MKYNTYPHFKCMLKNLVSDVESLRGSVSLLNTELDIIMGTIATFYNQIEATKITENPEYHDGMVDIERKNKGREEWEIELFDPEWDKEE